MQMTSQWRVCTALLPVLEVLTAAPLQPHLPHGPRANHSHGNDFTAHNLVELYTAFQVCLFIYLVFIILGLFFSFSLSLGFLLVIGSRLQGLGGGKFCVWI